MKGEWRKGERRVKERWRKKKRGRGVRSGDYKKILDGEMGNRVNEKLEKMGCKRMREGEKGMENG